MTDSELIFAIIAAVVVLFIWGRLPVILVALMVPLTLFMTGILTLDQSFAGFGDTVVIFIASLFVVASGLEATGVTAWVAQWLSRAVGTSLLRLSVLTMLIAAMLSPLISQGGAVAALVPVATLLALRMGQSPSKFLMPLAFASAAGSKLALTGTAKNVLISDAAADAGYGGFGFFEFAWVGIPLLAGTVLLVATLGRRLLPERQPANLPADLGQHARTLASQYGVGDGSQLFSLRDGSPLMGATRDSLAPVKGINLIAVSGPSARGSQPKAFAAGDVLVLRGSPEALSGFAQANLLDPVPEADGSIADMLFSKHAGLAEVVVKPRSKLVGLPMTPGSLTESGQFVVVPAGRRSPPASGQLAGAQSPFVGFRCAAGRLARRGTPPGRTAWPRFHHDAGDPRGHGAGAVDRRVARSGGRADRGHGCDRHWYPHRTTGLSRD